MAVIDRQQLFVQKIIDNMKDRDRIIMREGMSQFAEPTQRIVKQAIAVHFMHSLKLPRLG